MLLTLFRSILHGIFLFFVFFEKKVPALNMQQAMIFCFFYNSIPVYCQIYLFTESKKKRKRFFIGVKRTLMIGI